MKTEGFMLQMNPFYQSIISIGLTNSLKPNRLRENMPIAAPNSGTTFSLKVQFWKRAKLPKGTVTASVKCSNEGVFLQKENTRHLVNKHNTKSQTPEHFQNKNELIVIINATPLDQFIVKYMQPHSTNSLFVQQL